MDIGLPNMNGVDCVRQLKLKLPNTMVLMLTVYGDSERVFSALTAGANGYFSSARSPVICWTPSGRFTGANRP